MIQAFQDKTFSFMEKASLVKLRLKAMRSGVWFKALNRVDRALVNLTIEVARCSIRSSFLLSRLLCVTNKLEGLLESRLSRVTREVGFPRACKLGATAQCWGNKLAKGWAREIGFAKYLAVMNLNATTEA